MRTQGRMRWPNPVRPVGADAQPMAGPAGHKRIKEQQGESVSSYGFALLQTVDKALRPGKGLQGESAERGFI